MECYQQLFALIKNPKYVKMRLPKTGRPSELNNTANAGRIVRGRNGRKIFPAFLLTIFVAALATAAIPQEKKNAPKSIRRRSGKRSFVKAVRTIRQENRQERGKLPPLYAAVRVRRRSYGVSRIPRSVAGRITGYRRSLPQPSSAAWCPPPLHRSRAYSPHLASY